MLSVKKKKETPQDKHNILPFIDAFVDSLNPFSEFIKEKCNTDIDKKTILMFMMTYMYSYMNIDNRSNQIKSIMSDIIADPQKRSELVKMFTLFEKKSLLKIE